jgi:site-specific DNA recombinase
MTSAAIYARVSSARQKKDQTIGSQTAALRAHAAQNRLEVPEGWVFEDEGHSGATLVRPALERLRDLAAQGCADVVLCYSPDRLARKFAYQALLIEEFARAGVRTEFVNGPRGDSPEDQLLIQFQGMFAEYEKAQLMERYRRGKAYRARSGSVNVLGGAPFGYRYVRKTPEAGARYEVIEHEAVLAAEMFRRYADDGATIADLARWLTSQGVATRTGKHRWDRSVIWGMLRNPAYAGRAVFGKTQIIHQQPGLNRVARLQGRTTPRAVKTVDRPREEWTEIAVPAIVSQDTFARAGQRLEDNKRFASRNSKIPSLLQDLAACSACGYAYYRGHTTTTAGNKIYYYRCLGSDNYRYEGGRVCGNKPVRADYLDTVVWDHITGLLADPALIRAEIDRRLTQARTSDPVTRQRKQLELALAKAATSVTAMIEAYSEQLITIDELRARMPHLRAREANLRSQLDALDTRAADQDAYLKLADDLGGFLAQLRGSAATASIPERQRVLRLLVKDVLIGPEKITIRHRIPVREPATSGGGHHDTTDTEGDMRKSYPLCWGREHAPLRTALLGGREPLARLEHPRRQPGADQSPAGEGPDRRHQVGVVELVERRGQVRVQRPDPCGPAALARVVDRLDRVLAAAARPEPVRSGFEPGLPFRLQRVLGPHLVTAVRENGNAERAQLRIGLRYVHPLDRQRIPGTGAAVHPHRQRHPGREGQGDLPVDPRRLAAGVALRDLPHADQRVRPGPQHHLLQGPDPGQVPILRRLEDPAPQPPYVVLVQPPVNGVPLQGHVLGSVHHHGRLTCPSVPAYPVLRLQRLTRLTSACFRSRAPGPVSGRLYEGIRLEDRYSAPAFPLPFGRRRSLLGRPVPARDSGFPYGRLASGAQAAPLDPDGVSTFRTHEMRPGRVSSLPRERRCSLRPSGHPRPPSAALQRLAPTTPVLQTDPGCQIDEASTRIQGHSPFRPSPHL